MEEAAPQDMPIWVIVLIPIAFFIIFPIFWCFVMWINSQIGGWSRLAKRYRTSDEPNGKVWNSVQGSVGVISYRGVLRCVTNEDGLFLRPGMLFQFAHPELFIPWDDLHDVKRRNVLWFGMIAAKVGKPKVGSIALDEKVFEGSEGRILLP